MKKVTSLNQQNRSVSVKGLAVRTNLRAGLAWDDLDDKAKELWNSLTNAVSNATSALTNSSTNTPPTA